jgi:glycosyltransferase involved in cell wall biosynthesis
MAIFSPVQRGMSNASSTTPDNNIRPFEIKITSHDRNEMSTEHPPYRQLRVLHVSTADRSGGAERMAWSLFRAYRERGHKSWLAVGYKKTDDPDVLVIPNGDRRLPLWHRADDGVQRGVSWLANNIPGGWRLRNYYKALRHPRQAIEQSLGLESFHHPGTWKILNLLPGKPDVLHCHNLHGYYFDLRVLPWLSRQVPVILTLHDTWLLSGHCAHSLDCERWRTGCGRCPYPSIYPAIRRDATAYNWRRKQKIYTKSRFYVTTPSQWLMRKVEQSMLAPAVVEARVIANAVDLSVFRPYDRQQARMGLSLPPNPNTKILLFSANGIRRNRWKDYQTMRAAVALVAECLQGQEVLFIALGEDAPAERIGQAEIRFVPYQKDLGTVARYYQAADVYVHAARAEVWGLTITEALACGTPVVATAVGGISEQVKELESSDGAFGHLDLTRYGLNDATGILVAAGDARGMAFGVERLLRDKSLRLRMGENAARDAVKRFDLQRQADDFLRWYQEILKTWVPWQCPIPGDQRL